MISKKYSERGQALILIAIAAIVLFGFVALAIDGTAKLSDRRHAQNAADTAALAAALEKVTELTKGTSDNSPTTSAPATCPPPTGVLPSPVCEALQIAGLDRAASNGYDNDLTTNTVEVHSPPISGYYVGDIEYVQVIITSDVKTYFARIFGFDETTNILQAVAYTKKGGNLADGAMIISYDPSPNCSTTGTGGYSVSVSGSSTVNLNGGGIFLNSDEVCGFVIPNCADLNITGGSINSVGNNIDTGTCTFSPPVIPNINQDPIAIPDDVYWPNVPPECSQTPLPPVKLGEIMAGSPLKLTGEWLLHPGYYEDFPPSALVGNKQLIYMASGVYCIDPRGPSFDDDLSWSPIDFVSLYGSTSPSTNKYHTYNPDGVTLYIKSGGGFTINANNPTYLDASTDGDYQGYLIVLEGTHTSIEDCSISGGADIHIDGLIFAPYCDITVNGGSDPTAEINAQLIGWDIKVNGTTTINFNYDPSNQVKIKRKVGLMK